MGFEVFLVELRGGPTSAAEAREAVQELPHIRPDRGSIPTKGSMYYVLDDGHHAIELQVVDFPVRISCRFTLCHPPSVDSVFLALVRRLMLRLGMAARLCEDVCSDEDARPFSVAEFAEFSAAAARAIAARRAEWITEFGDHLLGATETEVYRRVILPRCQPGIGRTT